MSTRQISETKVSVVLCGYNQAAHVAEAVESVLSQTHQNLELIIIDNGSTDGSRELLMQYEAEPRVQLLLHRSNASVTKRLNEAIARTSGEYVSILYADDYYLPRKLERQLEEFTQLSPDYGVVYGPGYRLDAKTGRRWVDTSLKRSGDILEEILVGRFTEGFINPIAPLMRRESFVRYPYHEDMFNEGESIFLRFALTYKFRYVDEPLAVMREHDSNMGKAIKKNAALGLIALDKLLQEPEFPPRLMPTLGVFRADALGNLSWLAIRMAADPGWARACALEAVRRRPRQLLRLRTLSALAVSVLPVSAIRLLNRVMNAMGAHNETIAFKEDYS